MIRTTNTARIGDGFSINLIGYDTESANVSVHLEQYIKTEDGSNAFIGQEIHLPLALLNEILNAVAVAIPRAEDDSLTSELWETFHLYSLKDLQITA
tara:strand:+ start:2993 stop:3283 length:291 start_codon:yes stop_codon:yes gene_type:complete